MDFSELPSVPIFAQYIPSFPPDMSTTSTVTTLTACDHTLGDDTELLNCMCILLLAKSDGTPFHATFIQEEDIIEFFVELGQIHPEGVLQFLAMESVILFQSGDEMLGAACGVT